MFEGIFRAGLFGTDGIRGRTNTPMMNAELALRVGKALVGDAPTRDVPMRVVIGKDTRRSGYMIENALSAGLMSTGAHVFFLGPMPTPAVAMITRSMRADIGIMITASHNPYYDNGIKLFGSDGRKLNETEQKRIEKRVTGASELPLARPEAVGRAKRIDDARGRYVEFVKAAFDGPKSLKGWRVVLDAAHGASYRVSYEVLWELGADVVMTHAQPNGLNINEACGSTSPEQLAKTVVREKADIGFAFDGDGDRMVVVSDRGEVIDGTHVLGFMAGALHAQGRLNGKPVLTTEIANLALDPYLRALGVEVIRTPVGDRPLLQAMVASGSRFGAEASGHFVFPDVLGTSDGLLAAVCLLGLLSDSGQAVEGLSDLFTLFPQRQINVEVADKKVVHKKQISERLEKVRDILGSDGRVLLRASGTEPIVRVLVESANHEHLDLADEIAQDVRALSDP